MKFLFFVPLIVLGTFAASGAEPQLSNGVLVRVNDAIITYKDVFSRIGRDYEFLQQQFATQPRVLEQKIDELKAKYIEELVQDQLILHEFKTAGYNLPETYIEDRIKKDIRKNFGDRLTLNKTLQTQGLTYETYRKKVRDRIIIEAMWDQNVPRDPVISPHKIQAYYTNHVDQYKVDDQVKLRMIVVTNLPGAAAFSSRKMAEEILAKINEGVPFAEMAAVYSQRTREGEWWERSVLRADLAEKAFALKAGEHTGVIEAKDGCYLMEAEEVRLAHVKPITEVLEEIENTLKAEEYLRLQKRWIGRLKNKSFVRYYF